MSASLTQVYYVQLFVVSRFESVGLAADCARSAARMASGWYRLHRGQLCGGDFCLGDEVSHFCVRADGQAEETSELFESAENPLISILVDLVDWYDQAPHAQSLVQIIESARERIRNRV
jgi:hypothetical protein